MKKIVSTTVALVCIAGGAVAFSDEGRFDRIREFLTGVKEVPVVSTTGRGSFRATIDDEKQTITYTLTFAALEGDVRQSHIHIAPEQNSGNIMLWLCQTALNPNPTPNPLNPTPQCFDPANPATLRANTVKGTLTGADIAASASGNPNPPNHGVASGEFAEAVALIRAGVTYVNVHSAKFGPGEIRSQIDNGGGRSGSED